MATSTLPASPPLEYLPRIDGSLTTVALPAPRLDGGIPLLQALARRASRRAYGPDEIPVQVLSDLLWAAFGVNRPSSGLRTAPSAVNAQDIEIYLATAKGMFRFDARTHGLQAMLPDDVRSLTGVQASAGPSPVSLVYVSDYEKLRSLKNRDLGEDSDAVWSWTHTGFISQNVYLFCASEGLATVMRAIFDRDSLAERMGLDNSKHITLVQTVGYLA
jgi:SagB-type dehydrogenase family enzyme